MSIEQASNLFGPGTDTLLLIGNGFDLDLGRKTGYSDFVNSDMWPFKGRCPMLCGSLGSYLNKESHNEWFDLETSMADFAKMRRLNNRFIWNKQTYLRNIQKDDERLLLGLRNFLIEAEKGDIQKDSIASHILRNSCESTVPPTIYTFNYTDLQKIADCLHIEQKLQVNYVHGSLKGDDMILGFSEHDDIAPELLFMCKSRRAKFSYPSLFNSISTFKNVIFFGLSFGSIDYNYFRDFFDGVCNGRYEGIQIRIITKNEQSRQQILTKIGNMTGKIFDIAKHSNFMILRTSELSDKPEFDKLYRILNPRLGEDYNIDC